MFAPYMEYLLLLFVLALIAALIQFSRRIFREKTSTYYPYEKQTYLLSPTELSFFRALNTALNYKYRIMAKIRLADLIKLRPGTSGKEGQEAFNRISQKHVDFVACDPVTLSPFFVVELNDKTHHNPKRPARDHFAEKALEAAGIPIFYFTCTFSYTPDQIRSIILSNNHPFIQRVDTNSQSTYDCFSAFPNRVKDPLSPS